MSAVVFQSGGNFSNSVASGTCTLPDTVPKDKRLVLKTVTGFYYGDGAGLGAAYLEVKGLRFAFPWIECASLSSDPTDRRFYGFNHFVRIYIDGPAELAFDSDGAFFIGASASYSGTFAVSGHLIDL